MLKPEIPGQELEIEAEGARLAARFFAPQGEARAHLVLHGATGVPQSYYTAFAHWAAARGIGVLTYDYRDFGASLRRPLRESDADFADWALRDQAAAETMLAGLAPEGPLWVLGHSLGGLGFAFRQPDARITRIVTVGAGITRVTEHPWPFRALALAFWYVTGPLATLVAGYLPGRRLMLGADLPAGVYWQWRRWCTQRRFFEVDVGKSLPAPDFTRQEPALRILTVADDVIAPPAAVRRYAEKFPAGRVRCGLLQPRAFGLKALRHIEVFSARSAAAWPAILEPEAG